jgi:DNA polymerase-3 subunit delta'
VEACYLFQIVPGLAAIVGQDRAVARLRTALAGGRAHHAYLFDGPDGVGKRTTAVAFAQAANCERDPGVGCGACGSCAKIEAGTHPDLILFPVFNEEGKVKDQTERVRDLIAAIGFPPHEGRMRVVVIDPAHELNASASNVLLKTLEEPPPRTHFILVTNSPSRLLATIRSRCQRVSFVPLSDEAIAARLVETAEVEAQAAAAAAQLAGGSLGRALELASSEDLPRRRERVARLIAAAHGQRRSIQGVLDAAGELSGDRDEAMATLDLLWVTYHEALLIAARGDHGAAGGDEAQRLAGRVPTGGLLSGLRAVSEAGEALRGYVSPQLALERLLIRLGQAGAA